MSNTSFELHLHRCSIILFPFQCVKPSSHVKNVKHVSTIKNILSKLNGCCMNNCRCTSDFFSFFESNNNGKETSFHTPYEIERGQQRKEPKCLTK